MNSGLNELIVQLIECRDAVMQTDHSKLIAVEAVKATAARLLSEGIDPHVMIDALNENFPGMINLGTLTRLEQVVAAITEVCNPCKATVAIAGGAGLLKRLTAAKLSLAGYNVELVFGNRYVLPDEFDNAIVKGAAIIYFHDQSVEDQEDKSSVPAVMAHIKLIHQNGRFVRPNLNAVLVHGTTDDNAATLGVDAIVTDPLKIVETIESLTAASAA